MLSLTRLELTLASIPTRTFAIGPWRTLIPLAWSIGRVSSAEAEALPEWAVRSSGLISRRNASATAESESRGLQAHWRQDLDSVAEAQRTRAARGVWCGSMPTE